jgi:hypothetical protein
MPEPASSQSQKSPRAHPPAIGKLCDLVTGDEDARVCKDIPDAACRHQPRNFLAYIRRLPRRKGVWLLGALLSAVALVCMALATTILDGIAAGWTVLAMLALFSLARGLCSVSAKDVLGKTVSKTRRGALMGYSAAAAGIVTLLVGGYIELYGGRTSSAGLFMPMLLTAAGLWLVAIAVFALIRE